MNRNLRMTRKIPALILTAGMLFMSSCSGKPPLSSEAKTEKNEAADSGIPSYDPVPYEFESEYLKMVEAGYVFDNYEASVRNVEFFKDMDEPFEFYWKIYNDRIFIYAEKVCSHLNMNYEMIEGVDPDPTIYEYDLDGNLISSLRMIDFWADNFPNSNMYGRSSFITNNNLTISINDDGFIIGCDHEFCMYSFDDSTGRKIVTDHGRNPGTYGCSADGYFDGDQYITLTLDDNDWYLETFDKNGNHETEYVNSKGFDFGVCADWVKTGEDTVAVDYIEDYTPHHMSVNLNDHSWSFIDGNAKNCAHHVIDGYYADAFDSLYSEDGQKMFELSEILSLINGHEDEYFFYFDPEYTGCDDDGFHFLDFNDTTAEFITMTKCDSPNGKEVITILCPYQMKDSSIASLDIHSTVLRFNRSSDKYYCKLITLDNPDPETTALEYKAALSSDCPPDIIVGYDHYMILDDDEICEDMSCYLDRILGDDSVMRIVESCRTEDDKLYCIPSSFSLTRIDSVPDYCDDSYEDYLSMLNETSFDPIWASFNVRYSEKGSSTEAYLRLLIDSQLDLFFEKGYFDADAKVFYDTANFMLLNNYQMTSKIIEDKQGVTDDEWINRGELNSNIFFDLSERAGFVGLPSVDGRGAVITPSDCINVKAGSGKKGSVIEFLRFLFDNNKDNYLAYSICSHKGDLDERLKDLKIQAITDPVITDIIIEETMTYLDDIDGTVKLEEVAARINARVRGYMAEYGPKE